MKNDWYNILGLEDSKSISDVNVKVLLDEFFKKFIFIRFNKDGNIIVLYTKDKKEYKVTVNKEFDKEKFRLGEICGLSLILNVKNGDELIQNKLIVKVDNPHCVSYNITFERKNVLEHNKSSYFQLNKSKLNYYKSYEDKKEKAKASTDVFYIDKQVQTSHLLPDTTCITKIEKESDDNKLENYLCIQKEIIHDKETSFKSNLPIVYLLLDEHKEFLKKHDYEDKDIKNNASKTYKIGF